MKFIKRLFGICETQVPSKKEAWTYGNREIKIDLKQTQELAKPGGAVRLEGKGMPERVLVVHGSDGNFHAFLNKCTHMGRRIDPMPGKETIECCSVSKSRFNYSGDRISGAASDSLPVFQVVLEDDKLIIKLG
ncbi:Rieske [2Fe-2S] domain-containing protein [Desulfonema limicola]|uniref:Rieske [2Fe-2S] domain-containing protein n=1 Tax=Desulfonema limicola TaxID=45656 RepID=A0A975GHU6_9BACT|nr:Rieske 2Fe-2S domain-containing protein [Desulfonema limicola]QTA81734.1 Rieske [2Fe-2S] domain-containing protein [Desulfonema limicola]